MSVRVQSRGDTAANIAGFTPASRELIVDTTNNRLIVGDGSTVGGIPLPKLSEVPLIGAALNTLATAAHGALIQMGIIEQAVTLSGATTTPGTQIPANCIVFAVGTRVTTTVTGATSFSVGVSGTPGQFGSGLSLPAGSINNGIIGPTGFYSATSLLVTSAGGSFTGGALRLTICYMLFPPSTS